MEYLFLLIPFGVTVILLLLGWNLGKIEESDGRLIVASVSPTLFCLLLTLIISQCSRHDNFDDIEYLSAYVTKIEHEEDWDEWIKRTCTRSVAVGKDEDGNTIYEEEEYDCSYRDYHPDYYKVYYNDGYTDYVDEKEYRRILRLWGVSEIFKDMHRHYYTIDGDMYYAMYPGGWEKCVTRTWSEHYENRILGSESILKSRTITEEDAKKLGLYEYPNKDNPIIGINPDPRTEQRFKYLNGFYGKDKQIHVFVLVWDAGKYSVSISEDQKSYWCGGNKNELVICIGKKEGKIAWANCFSWQEDNTFDVKCRNYILEQKTLNLYELSFWLENNLGLWKRREFAEFSYIQTFLTSGQLSVIGWVIGVLGILANILAAGVYLESIERDRGPYGYYRRW